MGGDVDALGLRAFMEAERCGLADRHGCERRQALAGLGSDSEALSCY